MLYGIAKFIAVRAINIFYNKVDSKNLRYIPGSGPIIFTANHPNTMIDPMLIGYASPRDLYYLGKSTLFSRPIFEWILSRLHIIPVYRRQDNPDEMDKNVDTFEKCYDLLDRGESVLIFPEGISSAERTLSRIKTGAARIGFGTEARSDFKTGVRIIPVGINYSDLVRFRSDVYIRFGQPIELAEYRDVYNEDPIEAVHLVTERVETALQKLTVTLKELDMQAIVEGLETIYKKELILDMGLEIRDKNDEFAVTKGLIKAVEWFYEYQPEKVENFKKMLDRYLGRLEQLNLKDEFLSPTWQKVRLWKRIRAILFLVLGFPLYIFGLINNFLPYSFPRWYTHKFVESREWYAPMKLMAGAAVFLVYYSLLITAAGLLSGNTLFTIIYALLLIPSGNFVLFYLKQAQDYRQHLHFISIFYKKRLMIYKIIEQRMKITQFLNEARKEYMEVQAAETGISDNESEDPNNGNGE